VIGTRHGEKLYEVLLSKEEMATSEDLGRYFKIIPDARSLNYSRYTNEGNVGIDQATEYTSHNSKRLTVSEMSDLLRELVSVQEFLTTGFVREDDS
jgi:UDP-glucose 4-epimerase